MEFFKSIKDWFHSEERALILEALNKVQVVEEELEKVKTEINEKAYKSLRHVPPSTIVVFTDGTTATINDPDKKYLVSILDCKTKVDVLNVIKVSANQPVITDDDDILVSKNYSIIKNHPDFTYLNGDLYLKGVDLKIPPVIAADFIEVIEKLSVLKSSDILNNKLEALKMFWLKLAMNPIEASRKDIYNFITKNDVRITSTGNLVLYRRVVSTTKGDKTMDHKTISAISNLYMKVKSHKKAPSSYMVVRTKDNEFIKRLATGQIDADESYIGNLNDLYTSLSDFSSNRFTAYHDNKVDIRVGSVYAIEEDKINLNNGLCAAGGLHAASVNYNYSGFGDTPVVVLVSPSKAITVPVNDWAKLRTTEMFIAAINPNAHGVHYEFGDTAIDDVYHAYSIAELKDVIDAKKGISISTKENKDIDSKDLLNIYSLLKNRIVKI